MNLLNKYGAASSAKNVYADLDRSPTVLASMGANAPPIVDRTDPHI